MMNNSTRSLCLLTCMLLLTVGFHATANMNILLPTYYEDPIEVNLSTEWQKYSETNGVLIEYRMEKINSRDYGREVNMLFFRFTNTTDELKDCSWSLKIERDNECYNCSDDQNYENIFNLFLNPKETNEGDMSNLISRPELNIFGNFVKLVPGMTDSKLTGFELINLTIK